MENRFFIVIMIAFFTVFYGCKKSYSPLDYKNWIESSESGLNKKKTIGALTYSAQYQTPEYLVLLSQGPQKIQHCDLNTEIEKYTGSYHFKFTISCEEGIHPLKFQLRSEEQFYARQEYLNSLLMEDFYLVTSNEDTLNCVFAHAERDFGISPHLIIDLVFENYKGKEGFKLCHNDQLFNNGMIKFSFPSEAINDLPKLRQH